MESIVNNRPITAVSDDTDNCSALKPNSCLLQRATQQGFVFQEAMEKGAVPCGSLLQEVDMRVCAD